MSTWEYQKVLFIASVDNRLQLGNWYVFNSHLCGEIPNYSSQMTVAALWERRDDRKINHWTYY